MKKHWHVIAIIGDREHCSPVFDRKNGAEARRSTLRNARVVDCEAEIDKHHPGRHCLFELAFV